MPSVSSVDEAAAILADAARAGRSVRIGEDLTLDGLDRVLEHEAGDLTCTVEAGIRLRGLNARLARHGQMLALDPPGNPTIGGCIAANTSGPRRHRYGTPRDLVLGVTLVLPDGTVARSGGKVVKNVAGYDLGKLLCGSEGRLALIAAASLRLHPLPETSRTLVVALDGPAEAEHAWQKLLRSLLAPSAVDVLWPGRLAVLFEGRERAVQTQLTAARELLGGEEDGSVWDEVRARQAAARGLLLFPPGRLAEALSGLSEAVVRCAAGVAYVPQGVPDRRDESTARLAERVRAAFDPQGVLT